MVIRRRRKWFFKTVHVILEDAAAVTLAEDPSLDCIQIVSLSPLPLPSFRLLRKMTGVINCEGASADTLLASFSYENRHKIRKSYSLDGLMIRIDDTAHRDAYRLYRSFEAGRGARPYPPQRFEGSILLSAYYGSELISCVYLYPSAPVAQVNYIFSKRRDSDRERARLISIASRRLVFEACLWCITNGRTGLDLASVNPVDPEKAGINAFKMSFNPEVVPEYFYRYESPSYRLLSRALGFVRRMTKISRGG